MTYNNNTSRSNRFDNRSDNRTGDRTLPLTIQDISVYIKTNAEFINKVHINSYDEINNHLDNGNTKKTIKYLEIGEADLINLPENLDQIFGSYDLKRKKVLSEVKTPANADVSFISAILNAIVENYDTYKTKTKIDVTEMMIRKCLKEYQNNFKVFGYESMGWKAKDLRKTVSKFNINRELLRYIVDTLYINVFMLDIENDRLSYVGSDIYIKYKKNVFIAKFGNRFELIFEEGKNNKYVFDYSSGIVRKLINSSFCVEKIDCNYNNAEEDVEFVIGDEEFIEEIEEDNNDDNNTESDAESDKSNKLNVVNKLNKKLIKHSDESDDNGFEEGEVKGNENNYIVGITEIAEFSEASDNEVESDNESDDDVESDNESDNDVESDNESDKIEATISMLKSELVEMASKLDIDLFYKKSGKKTSKTKAMLVKDINESN
jgi:hypothetical protein